MTTTKNQLVLFLVLLTVLGLGLFFTLKNRQNSVTPLQNTHKEAGGQNKTEWEKILSEYGQTIETFRIENGVEGGKAHVVEVADLTGTEHPLALVDLGPGGAYTDVYALLTMGSRGPNVVVTREDDGSDGEAVGLAGASVRNGAAFDLLPKLHAIQMAGWSTDENVKLSSCNVRVYVYSAKYDVMKFDEALSASIGQSYCAKLQEELINNAG